MSNEPSSYRLLSYAAEERPRAGILVDDMVLDVAKSVEAYAWANRTHSAFAGDTTLDVLQAWEVAHPVLKAIAADARGKNRTRYAAWPLSDVRLVAPILYPGAVFGATANFTDHIEEMRKEPAPDKSTMRPLFFLKTTVHSIIGPDEVAHLTPFSTRVFWEGELAVVIGRPARYVPKEQALDYVAGYTILNDMSDTTDFQARKADKYGQWFGSDWFRNKCFDTSAPMGPWITPAEDVADPQDLSIKTLVSGREMQNGSTRLMYFSVAEQIEYLSERLTLRPGDVISTGTCAGVGRRENIFLKSGDVIEITIGNLGTLRNPVIKDELPRRN